MALRGARRPDHRGASATATAAGTRSCAPGTPSRPRCVPEPRHDTRTTCSPPSARWLRRSPPAPPRARRPAASPPTCSPRCATPGASGCRCRRATAASAPTSPRSRRLLETLARADASTAWTVMIGGNAWIDLAGLPRADVRQGLRPAGRHRRGRVRPVRLDRPGRRRVPGVGAMGLRERLRARGRALRQLRGRRDGELRMALLAPDDVQIEDTWTAAGLCGTGSHHFRVAERVVPADHTSGCSPTSRAWTCRSCRIPPPTLLRLLIASVAVGIAQGAVDDLLWTGRPQGAAARRTRRWPPTRCSRSSWPRRHRRAGVRGRCSPRPRTSCGLGRRR